MAFCVSYHAVYVNQKSMFTKIKESKITYLAFGIIAGLVLTYAYTKWKEKE